MAAEVANSLTPEPEREPGAYGYDVEAEQFFFRRPNLFWDKVAQKWPEGRFHSFFSNDKSA